MNPRVHALLVEIVVVLAAVLPFAGCDPQPLRTCRGAACGAESDAGARSDAASDRGASTIRIEPAVAELIAVDGSGAW